MYIYSGNILNSESSSDDSDTTSLCSDEDLGHGSTPVSVTHIDQFIYSVSVYNKLFMKPVTPLEYIQRHAIDEPESTIQNYL